MGWRFAILVHSLLPKGQQAILAAARSDPATYFRVLVVGLRPARSLARVQQHGQSVGIVIGHDEIELAVAVEIPGRNR